MIGWNTGRSTTYAAFSLRRRLITQLLLLAAVLAVFLYFAVRLGAERASEATQDAILGAATTAIADQVRSVEGGAEVNLPHGTFSMLGAVGEARVFYRIDVGGQTITGYDDLPPPGRTPGTLAPEFYTVAFRGSDLRVAAAARNLMIDNRLTPVLVLVGQTRESQQAIATQLANRAAGLGLGVFLAAIPLSLLAASRLLRPINRLTEAVGRRGPRDLRPVRHPAPSELAPLIAALNSFIGRLRGALEQTETFIAEAAHHIRTPLATMRSEAELALRHASDEATRVRLRSMIRAVDESARSAGQLLEHATVLYRADQQDLADVDLGAIAAGLVERFRPAAELKEMRILLESAPDGLPVKGDPVLIEAALRNLIDNAIKYSPPESEVELALAREGHMARVACRDHGRGLGGAKPAALMARFRRGPNAGDVVGSGLGLTIVSEAVGAMGGRFEIGPAEGGGTCATLWLPLSEA
jgi:two-component system, OmpR family, sensor histidine kinase TctE